MPSLKDLRLRIRSVKSTQKITSAMKMVAAAKLRRAQEQAEAARPYAERMERMIATLGARVSSDAPALLAGNGKNQTVLLIVASADRGLCGGFNTNIAREARAAARQLKAEGKTVKILYVGRKARDLLRREFAADQVGFVELAGKKGIAYADADAIAVTAREMFARGEIDSAFIIYAKFKSAISQILTRQQIIPAPLPEVQADASASGGALYEYEPSEEEILEAVLPKNLSIQVYRALLENVASEQGSRMTAMDNATRNAGDMINRLTLNYNRSRQAQITKELIEIISGAEAV